eukprot:TRINITY_DN146_c0_g1_i6.p1 TRINITY_DN146_c0_g1~~TRINITY_DN146_c0_g1_i6.p1  ORF type:complete len:126 (-),score=41.40 TRINITY_DN146_c0_g1_i6:635-1012(-)
MATQQAKEIGNKKAEQIPQSNFVYGYAALYPKGNMVTPYLKEQYTKTKQFWDKYYRSNTTKSFKDRHWLLREFNELLDFTISPVKILEVGCGVGNSLFPLLNQTEHLYFYSFDFSTRAIDFFKKK